MTGTRQSQKPLKNYIICNNLITTPPNAVLKAGINPIKHFTP
jgi:hypothetical protein